MQNSLERIFEGVENTLRTVVAPTISDTYVRTQVLSVAEIVANLSTRVEWRCVDLLELVERVRPILEHAVQQSPGAAPLARAVLGEPVPAAGAPNGELVEARDRHLAALHEVQRAPELFDVLDAPVREFVAWQLEREAQLLRTGMFSAAGAAGAK